MFVFYPEGHLVDGRPHRSKYEYPYSYDPITQFSNGKQGNSSCYSDRMKQWDANKYDDCSGAVSNKSDYWNIPSAKIEEFLRLYYADPTLELVKVVEYCNQATGFPVWYFEYIMKGKQ